MHRPVQRALATALTCSAAILVASAAAAHRPAQRRLLTGDRLAKAYPRLTFEGDVRVEPGVVIAPGTTLKATNGKPLYVLGKTTLSQAFVEQQGGRPLVLHNSKIEGACVFGGARLVKTKVQAGVVNGHVTAVGSRIHGVVVADEVNPLRLLGAAVEPLTGQVPRGGGYAVQRASRSVPVTGAAPVGVEGIRIVDRRGRVKADQIFVRPPGEAGYSPAALGIENDYACNGVPLWEARTPRP